MVTERYIDLGEIRLRIAESGAGQRPLLLVHGFTGAKEDLSGWLDQLADLGWHAVAPDLRGHGESSKPSEESAYSFKLMADDGLGLADALGWDRFVLLGHSMGGMIAQFMAIAEPSRLTGLILMDTAHGPLAHLSPELVAGAVAVVRAEGMDALAQVTAGREGPLHTPAHQNLLDNKPGYAEFGDRKLRATSPGLYAAMAPEFINAPDRLESLRQLPNSLPVLVIVGDQDEPFLGHSQRMADAIGGAALTVIPGAGHSPQFENTDAWWNVLTAYLGALESS
ncbi:MAG TPA: alpha/beta hydrolase [Streptosporangiaceae bacterium]|jgi:3-oxoadipate enol-lactonase|nr:alpha/beta hydrolase [Streptosporangiaceae bacterium]